MGKNKELYENVFGTDADRYKVEFEKVKKGFIKDINYMKRKFNINLSDFKLDSIRLGEPNREGWKYYHLCLVGKKESENILKIVFPATYKDFCFDEELNTSVWKMKEFVPIDVESTVKEIIEEVQIYD